MPPDLLGTPSSDVSSPFNDETPSSSYGRVGETTQVEPSRVDGFTCLRCDASYPATLEINSKGCPACHATAPANLRPRYAKATAPADDRARMRHSLWRFDHALPCAANEAVSLGEGRTPLVEAPGIGRFLGVPRLAIKDEGRNPTWSHKDRFSTVAVSVALAQGARVVATASSGNAGASLAAYASRAGLRCVVTTFQGSAGPMLAQIRKYGATVLPLANKMDRWAFLAEAATQHGWFVASPYHSPVVGSHALGIEGYKTIAYELVEQADGEVPDWCVMPVCYGDILSGVWAGFQDLFASGAIEKLPRMVAAEVHGSLQHALAGGGDTVEEAAIRFDSLAVSIGAPRSTYQALKALRESCGHAVPIPNDGLVDMQERLARDEGIFAELASVTPLLAIERLRREGVIAVNDRVVAIATASGLKDLDRSVGGPHEDLAFRTTAEAWNWYRQAEVM